MNKMPGVCIMIPTYNQGNYIVKAVESALVQDYTNIEIVIADDNSTDDTAIILKDFIENPAIKYRKNVCNLGRVANYKKCLNEYTTAEWVINLDGDDYFTNSQFISQAMHAISANGINDTLFYQGTHIIKSGEAEKYTVPNIISDQECMTSKDYFFDYFKRNYFSHMSTLYKREAAIKNNFYEMDIISADIFSFLNLCVSNGDKKVIVSKNISGVWYQHNANTSKTLHLIKHLKNFNLYIKLYNLSLEKGYNRRQCFTWLTKAGFIYAKSYFYSFLKIIKS